MMKNHEIIHIVNYHSQNRTCGSPSLRPDCLTTQAQMRLNVNHKFYWNKKLILKSFQFSIEENSRVCFKVAVVDGFNQLFSHFDDFLAASCQKSNEIRCQLNLTKPLKKSKKNKFDAVKST